MIRVEGMTLEQFNKIIDEMRCIYNFKDSDAYIGNLRDELTNSPQRVEIITTDKQTGITIAMAKGVDYEYQAKSKTLQKAL